MVKGSNLIWFRKSPRNLIQSLTSSMIRLQHSEALYIDQKWGQNGKRLSNEDHQLILRSKQPTLELSKIFQVAHKNIKRK